MLRLGLALACAAGLAGCYLSHQRDDVIDARVRDAATDTARADAPSDGGVDASVPRCAPPPTSPCVAWAADPVLPVSPAPPRHASTELAAVVESECTVIAAWSDYFDTTGDAVVRFATRRIGWDGAPLAEISSHDALTMSEVLSAGMELSASPGTLAGLVTSAPGGCVLAPLDLEGRDRASPVSQGNVPCLGLGPTDSGLSFLTSTPSSTVLTSVDPLGRPLGAVELPVEPGRAAWSRTMFPDGSFLLYTFLTDAASSVARGWLHHFDAHGVALAPEIETGVNAAPLYFAVTSTGVLSAWLETRSDGVQVVRARALDRDGQPTGATAELLPTGPVYGLSLASTPDGGALLAWLTSAADWEVHVQSLAPDGSFLGAPSLVLQGVLTQSMRLLVAPTGQRALLTFASDRIEALPLRCAD